ncbi:MAG: hypothetical protein JXA95_05735 [Spirochaetales bacterium]|nr:hypothetical protein [Spirochaetales bacterium]
MNLCINASHAMPDGGNLYLSTGKIFLDKNYCDSGFSELEPGHYVELIIEDTGSGIAPEDMEKIFDPFFTTKERGKGTGLGLSAVYGMVRQYKGEIKVYSELGVGTSFHVLLPISDADRSSKRPQESTELIKGRGTILI